MRRIVLTTAATLAILAAGSIANRADAMTVATPAGLQAAVGGASLLEDVVVRCRRVWRCGGYGCGWRRACWRTPYYGYYGGPYYGGYGYGGYGYGGYGYGYRPWRYW